MSTDIGPKDSTEFSEENEAFNEARLSSLSKALLRISASLDLETVLQETVDGATEVTGAQHGCMVTFDETGAPLEFVASGLSKEQYREFEQWSDGPELFKHLCALSGPERIKDIKKYARKIGINWQFPLSKGCMCSPIRHMGVQVGSFF